MLYQDKWQNNYGSPAYAYGRASRIRAYVIIIEEKPEEGISHVMRTSRRGRVYTYAIHNLYAHLNCIPDRRATRRARITCEICPAGRPRALARLRF